jgi:ribosomal-protein-alanine N-acetyltransferase
MDHKQYLEFRLLTSHLKKPLVRFFQIIQQTEIPQYFHPHPFTEQQAHQITHYQGQDLYYALLEEEEKIIGYGMLRGWDEGYTIPSLGICLVPEAQGIGLGRLFMFFLHAVAKRKGAEKIMLKVYPENQLAFNLYQKLGYSFKEKKEEQLVGFIEL